MERIAKSLNYVAILVNVSHRRNFDLSKHREHGTIFFDDFSSLSMMYVSTRDGSPAVSLPQAILTGLTPDGGLYFPERLPQISSTERKRHIESSYAEIAADVFARFSPDFSPEEIRLMTESAYAAAAFPDRAVAPVRKLDDDLFVLELFGGPTGAFKDFALQFLPRAMSLSAQKLDAGEICILVATSGDTGGAALAGFADVKQMHLVTFFPRNGVSPLQQAQMQCAPGDNVAAVEVEGDFDGAQKAVKEIFLDRQFAQELFSQSGIRLSSANSINIGRLLPQIWYVFAAHAQMVKNAKIGLDEPVDMIVPSGNMGDVFAAYLAKQMGLPIGKLVVANNPNDSSARFIESGTFDVRSRSTAKTISPAMDILRASNLERLLYLATDRDSGKVRLWMEELAREGKFSIDDATLTRIRSDFEGVSVSDEETRRTIAETFAEFDYLLDPHTAVGMNAYHRSASLRDSPNKKLLFSTAHYAKFGKTVFAALFPDREIPDDEVAVLHAIAQTATDPRIPEQFFAVLQAHNIHDVSCLGTSTAMKEILQKILKR